MANILIVEDEQPINHLIRSTLCAEGYQCDCAFDGKAGADLIEARHYDLILLDLMLPEISGYDLLEYVRPTQTPVIIISAMGQVQDRIRGLRMGADDYLSKPFQIGELVARVESVLRRAGHSAEQIRIGDVAIAPDSRQVWKSGRPVELTVKEFDLLLELARNKNVASAGPGSTRWCGRRNTPGRPAPWTPTSSGCGRSWTGTTGSRRCSASATGWRSGNEIFLQAVSEHGADPLRRPGGAGLFHRLLQPEPLL